MTTETDHLHSYLGSALRDLLAHDPDWTEHISGMPPDDLTRSIDALQRVLDNLHAQIRAQHQHHWWVHHLARLGGPDDDYPITADLSCLGCGYHRSLVPIATLRDLIADGTVANVAQWASCWPAFDQ